MSFTNGIGANSSASDATSVGNAAGEIAMDAAKVRLAGAMISQATRGSYVRFDKIAVLRQSIEAGTYHVSSASLAEKLISVLQK
jgi:anti-sigma28 factor (negative regulator of flagellin synthesis)